MCDGNSIESTPGFCTPCSLGTYKAGDVCESCLMNCVSCTSSTVCLRCNEGIDLNLRTSQCCSLSQIYNKTSEKCDCKDNLHLIEGICQQCAPGTVYSEKTLACVLPTNQTNSNNQN